jgi:hypothetical protein
VAQWRESDELQQSI